MGVATPLAFVEVAFGIVLLAVTVAVLGLGAWSWSNAIAAAHRARSHGISADEQARIDEEATTAATDLRRRARAQRTQIPDEELLASVLAEREYREPPENHEYTTESNEGIPEAPPIMPGGFYRPESRG